MINDAPRTPGTDPAVSSATRAAPADVCGTAIPELVRLILELTSTNAAIDYANAARIREELEHGLLKAQQVFEGLPEAAPRAEALRRLDGLRTIADRQLAIAPVPGAAAIAAAKAGDSTAWFRQADEWAAERLGYGSSRPRLPQRTRSDTRPESPGALRVDSLAPDDAMTTPLAPVAPEYSAQDEKHR